MLATLAVACGLSVGAAGLPKPVMDWGFSRQLDDYRPTNYGDQLAIAIVERDGARVLSIRNEKPPLPNGREPDTSFGLETDAFDVTAGAEFAVHVKARGTVRMQVPTPPPCVRWLGADGNPLTTVDAEGKTVPLAYDFCFETGSDRWQETLVRGVVPAEAKRAKLMLRCDQPNIVSGKWLEVAGVSYYERKEGFGWDFGDLEAPEVVRVTPSPCADLKAAVTFKAADRSALDKASFRCLLDGADVTAQVVWNGNSFSYRPPAPWAWHSFHEFVISLADAKGNRFEESRFVFFGEPCRGHAKGALRDDGMLLVDGKPFFPISIASVRECPLNGHDVAKGVADLKAAGFNVLGTYMVRDQEKAGDYERFIRACDELGVKVWPEPAVRTGANRDRKLFETVLEGRRHPSTLAWCIGDDTAMHRTPGELKRDRLMVEAIDDRALTEQSDICHTAGRFGPYAFHTDVFKLENYPVRAATPQPDEMPAVVRDIELAYRDLKTFNVPPRCIVSILQAFSGWTAWHRFPTYEEVRAQTFLSIAARARGVSYYTYWSPNGNGAAGSAEQFETLSRVTREVERLLPHLTSRDAAVQPKMEIVAGPAKDAFAHASVTFLLKESGLLVAGSTAVEPVTARFTLPDGKTFEHVFSRNGVLIVGE